MNERLTIAVRHVRHYGVSLLRYSERERITVA